MFPRKPIRESPGAGSEQDQEDDRESDGEDGAHPVDPEGHLLIAHLVGDEAHIAADPGLSGRWLGRLTVSLPSRCVLPGQPR